MIFALAFAAMFAQDVLLTWKSIAANRNHPIVAGGCDMLGGFCVIATVGIGTGTALNHGLSWQTVGVFAALGLADFTGSYLGTSTGTRWIHSDNLAAVKGAP
jgi:hypothetical protein